MCNKQKGREKDRNAEGKQKDRITQNTERTKEKRPPARKNEQHEKRNN